MNMLRKTKLVRLGRISRVTKASVQGEQPEISAPFLSRTGG